MHARKIPKAVLLAFLVGGHSAASAQNVVGWGDNTFGQLNAPAGMTFAQITMNESGAVAGIRGDGTLAAWGNNSAGQVIQVPAGTFRYVFGQGSEHFVAIKTDGSLTEWGSNHGNALNVPTGQFVTVTTLGWIGLGVRTDGTLAGWGRRVHSGNASVRDIYGCGVDGRDRLRAQDRSDDCGLPHNHLWRERDAAQRRICVDLDWDQLWRWPANGRDAGRMGRKQLGANKRAIRHVHLLRVRSGFRGRAPNRRLVGPLGQRRVWSSSCPSRSVQFHRRGRFERDRDHSSPSSIVGSGVGFTDHDSEITSSSRTCWHEVVCRLPIRRVSLRSTCK